jgi:outer membrane PBP1 activator LpoA protein
MGTIDRGSDLFNQYVKKLTGQEQRIETLRGEIAALQEREQEARKGLDAYLLALDVK